MTGIASTENLRLPNWLVHAGLIVLAGVLAYGPFMAIPLISDTYLQIALARDYGAPANWPLLAEDPLYRCRGTSLVFTWLVDAVAGPSALAHRTANLLLHILNSLLMLWLLRRTPWIWAGLLFAAAEVHQEAVIWEAALPELLVFLFLLLGLSAWEHAVRTGTRWAFAATSACYLLALASKESGVVFVPLAAAIWLWRGRPAAPGWLLAALAVLAGVYTLVIVTTGDNHLHLTDGTFSLRAPFLKTELISITRILTPFGFAAAAVLWLHRQRGLVGACLLWMFLTLLPYAFLLYMQRVPSRHTYIASAALAVLIAAAAHSLWNTRRRWLGPALIALFLVQNLHWLWTRKYDQYVRRAVSTEKFIDFVRQSPEPVRIDCAPYSLDVYRSAARVALGRQPETVLHPQERPEISARSFCDRFHP